MNSELTNLIRDNQSDKLIEKAIIGGSEKAIKECQKRRISFLASLKSYQSSDPDPIYSRIITLTSFMGLECYKSFILKNDWSYIVNINAELNYNVFTDPYFNKRIMLKNGFDCGSIDDLSKISLCALMNLGLRKGKLAKKCIDILENDCMPKRLISYKKGEPPKAVNWHPYFASQLFHGVYGDKVNFLNNGRPGCKEFSDVLINWHDDERLTAAIEAMLAYKFKIIKQGMRNSDVYYYHDWTYRLFPIELWAIRAKLEEEGRCLPPTGYAEFHLDEVPKNLPQVSHELLEILCTKFSNSLGEWSPRYEDF